MQCHADDSLKVWKSNLKTINIDVLTSTKHSVIRTVAIFNALLEYCDDKYIAMTALLE